MREIAIDRSPAWTGLARGLSRGRAPVLGKVLLRHRLSCPALCRGARAGVMSGPGATPAYGGSIRHKPLLLLLTVAVSGSPQAHSQKEVLKGVSCVLISSPCISRPKTKSR